MTRLELQGKYDKKKAYRERHKDRVAANKRRYRQTEEAKIIQRKATLKYGEKLKVKLPDKYVVGLLIQFGDTSPEFRKLLYANKPLIEAKRQQILLSRLANQKINE